MQQIVTLPPHLLPKQEILVPLTCPTRMAALCDSVKDEDAVILGAQRR